MITPLPPNSTLHTPDPTSPPRAHSPPYTPLPHLPLLITHPRRPALPTPLPSSIPPPPLAHSLLLVITHPSSPAVNLSGHVVPILVVAQANWANSPGEQLLRAWGRTTESRRLNQKSQLSLLQIKQWCGQKTKVGFSEYRGLPPRVLDGFDFKHVLSCVLDNS